MGLIRKDEKIKLKDRIFRLLINIVSKGKLQIYYVIMDNRIVHTSIVLPKIYKFPFMHDGDYEIGPCQTNKNYRGKGIYKKVVLYIQSNNPNFYRMIVSKNNTASLSGIKKTGFVYKGVLLKNKRKIYIEAQ